MPLYAAKSTTAELTLEEVIHRLAHHTDVDGVLLLGSTGTDSVTPISDYDLLIVLTQMPAPLHVGATSIDGRFSDIIFVTTEEIDGLLSLGDEIAHDTWQGRLLHWFATGKIAADRTGRMVRARNKAQAVHFTNPADTGKLYGLWFGINYNLKQTQRMLAAGDAVYDTAVDLRLLYCLSEVWSGYFQARDLPWRGEKEAIRLLMEIGQDFLEKFRKCLDEPLRQRKVERYAELAALALAPLGSLWQQDVTAIQFHASAWQTDQDVSALTFWEKLVAD